MKRLLHILVIIALVMLTLGAALPAQAATPAEINDAITDGLAWLATQQNPAGYFTGSGYLLADTASAVLAFENEGHFPGGGTLYSINVEKGLDWIFLNAQKQAIVNQTVGYAGRNDNPDTNGNGLGVFVVSSSRTYETGMVMQAIADSHTPDRVVGGVGPCAGMTYAEVLTDMVDWCAWGQIDVGNGVGGGGRGGWTYNPVSNSNAYGDGSISQWPVLGFIAAEQWGIFAPAWVKSELNYWIDYIQDDASGGGGYNTPGDGMLNVSKTGGLLVYMYYYGDNKNTPRAQAALTFLNNNWNAGPSGTWFGNQLHPYAMYAVFKGLSLMNVDTIPSAPANDETPAGDWWGNYCEVLVNNQNANGSWTGYGYWTWSMATGWYIIILQATVFPVSVDIEVQPPACTTGYNVNTTYSVQRFEASGTVKIYEDGALVHTVTLSDFQGSVTYTHPVASDTAGPHTWRAVLDVITGGGIEARAEDTAPITVVVCETPPGPEVGGDVYPINRIAILTPWIVLAIVIAVGTTILIRRRQNQS